MADDDGTPGDGQGDGDGGQGEGAVTRGEFESLDSKVDRLLSMFESKGPPAGKDAPGDIGAQVRAGIEQLEAKKRADEAAAADKARADEHDARLKALEEVPPGEPDSWVDKVRRRIYGQERDGSATPRRSREGAAR